jgi:type I restriction enzyme S subunit
MNAWKMNRLDECCDVVSGATPSTSVADYWDGAICWATPKDLSELEGVYISDTPRKLTEAGLQSCAATVLPAGSVLFSSRAPIGHVAVTTRPMATNQGFKSFVPKPDLVDAKYLYFWLRANRPYLESLGNGATFKEVSKAVISRVEIPLPPPTEQRRIAEVLDRAETLRAKRRTVLAQVEALTHVAFLEMFGDPAHNTKDLPTVSLGELGKWQSGGTPPRKRKDYFVGEVPWFSSGELNDMYAVDSNEHISETALAETSAKPVAPGSLLLGMYDTAALKASIAEGSCSCNQAVAFATIQPQLADTIFVYYSIILGREHFRRRQRGVRQKNLNLSMIRDIRIPLPPLDLQREFARRVEAVARMKAAQRASLAELDALFASLQHRAFRGEL